MRALFEILFDLCYLTGAVLVGVLLLRRAGERRLLRLFGAMALVLGLGDAVHLLPRCWALWSGRTADVAVLGVGKAVTSVTATVFYLLLYRVWQVRYGKAGYPLLSVSVWLLGVARILLCLAPQNQWLEGGYVPPWPILRNLPFALLGLLLVCIYLWQVRRCGDSNFRFLPLAVAVSFACYVPVVLWADVSPMVGMLMIPKTLAYVWVLRMGWRLQREPEEAL